MSTLKLLKEIRESGDKTPYATLLRQARKFKSGGFREAFKSAREKYGSEGTFEWNGKLYNTKYKEEVKPYPQGSFNAAFKEARTNLGAGKEFEWNGNKYTTDFKEEVSSSSKPTLTTTDNVLPSLSYNKLNSLQTPIQRKIEDREFSTPDTQIPEDSVRPILQHERSIMPEYYKPYRTPSRKKTQQIPSIHSIDTYKNIEAQEITKLNNRKINKPSPNIKEEPIIEQGRITTRPIIEEKKSSEDGEKKLIYKSPTNRRLVVTEDESKVITKIDEKVNELTRPETYSPRYNITSPSEAVPTKYYSEEEFSDFTYKVNLYDSKGYRKETSESVLAGNVLLNDPKFIILHHTGHADNQTIKSIHNQFMESEDANSHLLIDEDGTINIYATPAQIMAHAGKESSWGAEKVNAPTPSGDTIVYREALNRNSIGIELFNRDTKQYPITEQQVISTAEAIAKLLEEVPDGSLDNVLTHEMIAPNKKHDIVPREYIRIIDKLKSMGYEYKDKELEEAILNSISKGTLKELNYYYKDKELKKLLKDKTTAENEKKGLFDFKTIYN